jgi:hypothetical protein
MASLALQLFCNYNAIDLIALHWHLQKHHQRMKGWDAEEGNPIQLASEVQQEEVSVAFQCQYAGQVSARNATCFIVQPQPGHSSRSMLTLMAGPLAGG